ncbi:MAG: tRNA pseudouridine(55) synthase TruB [Patescibacteria group bacterium]|nr:tRNA pseudouridine(55) synthase TruB [Patescibacteria group bacterium]
MNKILLIDKPAGFTSFDVVAKIRGKLRSENPGKKIKVGHTGTLDPFATGLLVLLLGSATKEQDKYMKLDKEYEATLKLGHTSTTGDPEGVIEKTSDKVPTTFEIKKVLKEFTGEIEQVPPAFSAIKVNGERAYKLARAGKEVNIKARKITIYEVKLLRYDYPKLEIQVRCSSGTYVRTLAEDIGKKLGTGAYLTNLRRTKVGEFDIKDASSLDEAIKQLT